VPPLEDPRVALSAVSHGSLRRAKRESTALELSGSVDPRAAELRSHRPVLGVGVRAAKHAVLRLLDGVFERQSRSNAESLAALDALARRGARSQRMLEERLDALEAKAARVAGRLAPPSVVPFDYEAFESAFRGDPARLRPKLEGHRKLLEERDARPVLDLGCGRGTFLEMLREHGVDACGIDSDPRAVAIARSRGLDVREGDLLDGLRAWPDASLGAIVSLQVIEHLPLAAVQEVLRVAREKLRPGGTLVLETVNIASAFALAHGWSIDPTHRLRLHPRVLRSLAESAGFQNIELRGTSPVESESSLELDEVFRKAGDDRLDWIFSPQDAVLVAKR
jgi:SAM-dependent methyltransferase